VVDALASTLVHELDETLTDLDRDGWFERWSRADDDSCASTNGPLRRTAGVARTSLRLGGRDLVGRRNWVVAPRRGCAMAASAP